MQIKKDRYQTSTEEEASEGLLIIIGIILLIMAITISLAIGFKTGH